MDTVIQQRAAAEETIQQNEDEKDLLLEQQLDKGPSWGCQC